jgi:aspartyl aminopeptidase
MQVVKTADGGLESKLVDIRQPVARIPNLAIHLTKGTERESFTPNLHSHAQAMLTIDPATVAQGEGERFHPALLGLVSADAEVNAADIVEMELQLVDVQPSCLGGLRSEFIYSGRLDNLCSAYQCVRSLIDTPKDTSNNVRVVMLFDHEEVGSCSATGAGSSIFMDSLTSIHQALNPGAKHGSLMRDLRSSFVVSIDMAHALHPNYTEKHDPSMAPVIGQGLVIKHNANHRYATNAMSASIFRQCAQRDGVPVQEFSVRSDSGCGRCERTLIVLT